MSLGGVVLATLGAALAPALDDPATPGVETMVLLIFDLARVIFVLAGLLSVLSLAGFIAQRRQARWRQASTSTGRANTRKSERG